MYEPGLASISGCRRVDRPSQPNFSKRWIMVVQAESTECGRILQAVEGADEGPEQWQWLRTRLAVRVQDKKFCPAELCRAYEERTGTWTGCD